MRGITPPYLTASRFFLLHCPENPEDLSEDHTVLYYDRIHRVVLRLQPDMTIFFVESLNGCSVFYKSYNNFTISCRIAGIDEDQVSVKDPGVDHGFSTNSQGK